MVSAEELVEGILGAHLYSSEEKIFGDFFEELAIFIASKTANGKKSSATGIDLEFFDSGIHYIVSIKSGPNWGNNAQQKKQEEDFNKAVRTLKQSRQNANVQAVLGICYGKTKTSYVRSYLKVVGQSFWHLISNNKELYTDIIEPIGYRAEQHNEEFDKKKAIIINQFTQELLNEFCHKGAIDWKRLVEFNSGNMLK